uniref:Transcriptional coactivator p15 (PC4) C-terminal domain-containing protein n=1 Tax=Nelumbo nucifera TaxID=4432 RepID=A0A822Z7X7_NELNU|nr:TPA_asm: hypothetical protein HUJ06_014114 [Nelumbo nucifera]
MSRRWKRKEEENASDGDSDGAGPAKKTFKKGSDDSDGIVVCEISKNRRVSVRSWQGKVVVDIREFYVKDGKELPGKKGSSFFSFYRSCCFYESSSFLLLHAFVRDASVFWKFEGSVGFSKM